MCELRSHRRSPNPTNDTIKKKRNISGIYELVMGANCIELFYFSLRNKKMHQWKDLNERFGAWLQNPVNFNV